MSSERLLVPTVRTYAGLFFVTLATLMYEVLLTRIFSVTMWYHFAFVAISVALFGMTVGAILIYLFPRAFGPERLREWLAVSALGFSLFIVLSFVIHLILPFGVFGSVRNAILVIVTYLVMAVPFMWSGVAVTLVLTKFPSRVNSLYAADLAGAATGTIFLMALLHVVDGPTAVLAVAFLASVGAWFFSVDTSGPMVRRMVAAVSAFLALLAVVNGIFAVSPFRIEWVKGRREPPPLYERWNSFSRVQVHGDPDKPEPPFGWGMSVAYSSPRTIPQLLLTIDGSAATFLTKFDGNLAPLDFLKYDIVNLAYYLRRDARALVVGSGGGRDVLSALVFGAQAVTGVEVNSAILNAVNERFGDFTGHLDRHPKVTFVNDEARSYFARRAEPVDLIQVSLTDTWAATAAGAFVLTESALYTTEAWERFMDNLTPTGILTVSRWYVGDYPGEIYRLIALARAALEAKGVPNPRDHIMVVRNLRGTDPTAPPGIGTILVGHSPFSKEDIDTIEAVSERMQFEPVLTPRAAREPIFAALASGEGLEAFSRSIPINISPPTDDKPFFFQMLRFRDLFRSGVPKENSQSFNLKAVFVLAALLIAIALLTILAIIVPLFLKAERAGMRRAAPALFFFASIGFGFMLVEISQMQRLIIFLGHPIYGLSVVLFSLLLASGIGSYVTASFAPEGRAGRRALGALCGLLAVLFFFGVFTPRAIEMFAGTATPVRILVALGILFPLGFFMGMPFPLGMRVASMRFAHLTPWLWGVNGATSVFASVFAVAFSLAFGIAKTFWVGFLLYVAAFMLFLLMHRRMREDA